MEPNPPRLAPETPDLVWFRGPDTIRFLNDIISQEVGELEAGKVTRSLLLEPQGKLAHLLWVMRGVDEIGLLTDPGRGGELASALGRYRIRVDVEIEQPQIPSWMVVGDWGPEPGTWERRGDHLVADISWSTLGRTYGTGPAPDFDEISSSEYEKARIEAGEPRWGRDVTGDTIPHESGLVPATVDFTKGCFLGQELVARIDSRGGNVPRRLRLLELGDAAAEPGSTVTAEGKDVGTITSASGKVALATLKRGVEPGDEVIVGGTLARVMR
jgi:folate-binding protein YgfZ